MNHNNTQMLELRARLLEKGGKALLIQTAFLGDVILATPLARAFKAVFPKAALHTLTLPQTAVVLKPWADESLTIDKRDRAGLKEAWKALTSRITQTGYDLALIPHRSWRSGRLAFRAGIPVRIGFRRGAGRWFHSEGQTYQRQLYEGRRNLTLLSSLVETNDEGIPELRPSEKDHRLVESLLQHAGVSGNRFAVIAPSSVWFTKRWPESYFRRLRESLERDYLIPVLAIGGSEDRELAHRIVSRQEYCLAGQLSILQSAALISRACLHLSGDTAPAHIATAVGTRQVIIYGSTVPAFGFAPPVDTCRIAQITLWCRPCTSHGRHGCPKAGKLDCLKEVTPEKVIKLAEDWL